MSEQSLKYIGAELKRLRQQRELRQIDIATGVGVNYRHYQNIESGKVDLRVSTLFKFLEFMKIEIQEFFRGLPTP